jgi:hypothetical protein
MSDEKQDYKLTEEHDEQPGGWFTSPQSKPLSGSSQESNNFFDRPPFLFAAFVWLFPYAHMFLIGFTVDLIVDLVQTIGVRPADFFPLELVKAQIFWMPFLFFLYMSTKGTWFLNRLFFLLPVWSVFYLMLRSCQDTMMAPLSKVYGVGQ